MQKYLVTYHGGRGVSDDPEERQQQADAFTAWAGSVGPALVDGGAPLAGARTVTQDDMHDGQLEATIGGYSLLEAPSLDAAAEMVRSHPYVRGGGTLQVSEAVALG
jgi:hypothetical protein